MARRLHQTLADYVVIAISPALIMALVGSLVFFLLRVFYQGEYQGRLHWVMACFVFAAVLIGRISIEEGFERASVFGAALAVAMGIATNRFMEFHGAWIENISWLINWSLIGLAWWCAHKLVWDCTLIDDSQDSSGEGLLQTAGLEKPGAAEAGDADARRLEGTTSRQVPASYWQRYVEHQRRPHAPGVWVVYFSLAALPLFGIGQWLIPEGDAAGRRSAFWLLSVYVASALALLLTTSFLGLRRYLRQRRIEMPTLMANLWLGTGAVLIAALVVLAALLPRPSAEYAISQLPFTVGSPDRESSRLAPVPKEGTHGEEPGQATERETQEPTEETQSSEPDAEASVSPDQSAPGKDAGAKSSPDKSGAQKADGEQGSKPSKSGGQGQQSKADSKQSEEPSDAKSPIAKMQQRLKEITDEAQAAQQQSEAEPPAEAKPEETSSDTQEAPRGDATPSIEPATEAIAGAASLAAELFRWVLFGVIVVAALLACWRYRAEIAAAFREFLAALADFWNRLMGRRRSRDVGGHQEVEIKVPPAPFSSFADPFATGIAHRYSMVELVRYSFEAFEAWSREHGCPRQADQTPHELARDVGKFNAFIAVESRNLAELYARAAYAGVELPANSADPLRRLWEKMRQHAGNPVAQPAGWPPARTD